MVPKWFVGQNIFKTLDRVDPHSILYTSVTTPIHSRNRRKSRQFLLLLLFKVMHGHVAFETMLRIVLIGPLFSTT